MRFFADGPNIPDALLEDRDNGNVVFFCGAGISRPAGLPGFADLAEQVVQELGAPPEAKVRAMLARAKFEPDGAVPLDQIFSILQQEYHSANIDDIVSRLLKTPPSANVDQHLIILRLSKNAADQTQIVTTNFDLLFERAKKGIQRHVAPALPDLSSGQPLAGLVYLHGRLHPRVVSGIDRHQLILSSSDFGRAYLADGWATRFVRDLLKNYVIVLLGYNRRELLHLLRDRWSDIPPETREKIEERIIAGRTIEQGKDIDGALKNQASISASMLGWMRINGCILSDNTASRLPTIQAMNPDWDARWELGADQSLDGRTGYVAVRADPTKIIDLPISRIIEAAEQQSTRPFMEFTEHRPFSGLVKQRPERALAALAYQARRKDFPLQFWETALADWPEELSERLQWLFAARLARLPTDIIFKLPHYAPNWLKQNLPPLAQRNAEKALAVWDSILNGLVSDGAKPLESGIGDTLIGGKTRVERAARSRSCVSRMMLFEI
jgi:hypothetical protein